MPAAALGRTLRVGLQADWDPHTGGPGHQGLLAWDQRVRTLLRVLVSYPEVRYILPAAAAQACQAPLPRHDDRDIG